MTGERRLNGNFRGFFIADFTNHHDIRILAEKRAQSHWESVTLLFIHLSLQDAFETVFDWVFNGYNFCTRLVEKRKQRIKSCRFSRSGGAGVEDYPIGLFYFFQKPVQILLADAELKDVSLLVALAE